MDKPPLEIHCPTCGKAVVWGKESPSRPFCSERCRLIDLGEWFEERHKIPEVTSHDGPADWSDEDESQRLAKDFQKIRPD